MLSIKSTCACPHDVPEEYHKENKKSIQAKMEVIDKNSSHIHQLYLTSLIPIYLYACNNISHNLFNRFNHFTHISMRKETDHVNKST